LKSLSEGPQSDGVGDYYIAAGDNSWGPYSAGDIHAMSREGTLADYTHVWDPAAQAWIPLDEWLNAGLAVSPAPPEQTFPSKTRFACRGQGCRKPGDPAVTICGRCGAMLCADCVRFGEGDFLCARCAPSIEAPKAEAADDAVRGWFAPMQKHPDRALAVVIALALAIFLFLGRSPAAAVDGISNAELTRYWQQATRALRRAHFLMDQKREPEARKWLELADAAAAKVVADNSIAPGIWEQAFTYRMRAALDRENYAKLHELVGEFDRDAKRVTRERDLRFFKACDLYLFKNDSAEAIKILEQMMWGGNGWDNIGQLIDFASQRNPLAQEKAKEFMMEGFTRDELLFRLGECYALAGRRDDAVEIWKQAAVTESSEDEFLDIRDRQVWRRKAEEELAK
jgi:tetratricopeptide (TPR) repeat protein